METTEENTGEKKRGNFYRNSCSKGVRMYVAFNARLIYSVTVLTHAIPYETRTYSVAAVLVILVE